MKKTLLTISITVLALLTGLYLLGAEDDPETPYQYGVLKSNPPIPPLTYTWSHPDCPFTVNFPGEPKTQVRQYSDGFEVIEVTYPATDYLLSSICIADANAFALDNTNLNNKELLEKFVNSIFQVSGFEDNPTSKLPNLSHTKKMEESKSFTAKMVYNNGFGILNGIGHLQRNAIVSLMVSYNGEYRQSNGAEFFESVCLKQDQ